MPFAANVVQVLIASPGDTAGARNVVEDALHRWNADRAEGAGTVLLPRRWETDAVPLMGADAQSIINRQLVDQADIVFGVFWSKVGSPTPRGESGTVEEITRAVDDGKRVHVYFSDVPINPAEIDPDQLKALLGLKERLQAEGLYGVFQSDDDLRTQVRSALEHDLSALGLGTMATVPTNRAARPNIVGTLTSHREVRAYDKKGKPQYRTITRFTLGNTGNATAKNVRVTGPVVEDRNEGLFILGLDKPIGSMPAGTTKEFGAGVTMGGGGDTTVRYEYQGEDGSEYSDEQTL